MSLGTPWYLHLAADDRRPHPCDCLQLRRHGAARLVHVNTAPLEARTNVAIAASPFMLDPIAPCTAPILCADECGPPNVLVQTLPDVRCLKVACAQPCRMLDPYDVGLGCRM